MSGETFISDQIITSHKFYVIHFITAVAVKKFPDYVNAYEVTVRIFSKTFSTHTYTHTHIDTHTDTCARARRVQVRVCER